MSWAVLRRRKGYRYNVVFYWVGEMWKREAEDSVALVGSAKVGKELKN